MPKIMQPVSFGLIGNNGKGKKIGGLKAVEREWLKVRVIAG